MKRSVWLTVAVAVLATATLVGCAKKQPTETGPTPPEGLTAEPAGVTETFPDSVGELGEAAEGATVATTDEVSDEMQRMFGDSELPEVEPEGPSWDIPITINDAVERWLEYFQTDGRENFAIYLSRAGRY